MALQTSLRQLYEQGFLILALQEAQQPSDSKYQLAQDSHAAQNLHRYLQGPSAASTKPFAVATLLTEGDEEEVVDLSTEKQMILEFIARNKIDELPDLIRALQKGLSTDHLHYTKNEIQLIYQHLSTVHTVGIAAKILNKNMQVRFPKLSENIAAWNLFCENLANDLNQKSDDEDDFLSCEEEETDQAQACAVKNSDPKNASADTSDPQQEPLVAEAAAAVAALALAEKSPAEHLSTTMASIFHEDTEFATFLCNSLLPKDLEKFTLNQANGKFVIVLRKKHTKLIDRIPQDGITSLNNCNLMTERTITGRIEIATQTVYITENHLSMASQGWIPISGAMTSITLEVGTGDIYMGTNSRLLPRIGPYTKKQFYQTFGTFSWG